MVVVAAVLIGAGVVSFLTDQASRQVPLNVPLFDGAAYWGRGEDLPNSRKEYYRVTNAQPDEVMAFYQEKLNEHTGGTDEQCNRYPELGEFPASELGPGIPPYRYICLFDRSGFQSTQYTRVTISPGLPNENPDFDTEGMTIVEYYQVWQS